MSYDNTNSGVLFINDRKRPDKKDPDRTGSINVEGVEYFLDGWLKEKNGKTFLSLSVKRKDKQPGQPQQQREPQERPPSKSVPKPPRDHDPLDQSGPEKKW